MFHNLLTIGEVAKSKGISIKTLRHYDEIGLFSPAYIDPQTNYRYYSMEQLPAIHQIQLCRSLDIPLAQIKSYLTDGQILDMDAVMADCQRILQQKEAHLANIRALIDFFPQYVADAKFSKENDGYFYRNMEPQHILTAPWDGDLKNVRGRLALYGQLIEQCKGLGIQHHFYHGFFRIIQQDGTPANHVFWEIPEPTCYVENHHILPTGYYLCQSVPYRDLDTTWKQYCEDIACPPGSVFIVRNQFLFAKTTDDMVQEVQLFVPTQKL